MWINRKTQFISLIGIIALFIQGCDAILFDPKIQKEDPFDDGNQDLLETIQITYPIGGETFDLGSLVTITWASSVDPCEWGVNIKLYEDGDFESNIVINTDNDGEFDWYVDTELDSDDDYQILIEGLCYNGDYCNGCLTSNSPGTFTISDNVIEPIIQVISPMGGESYALDEDTLKVIWTSNIPESIWGMKISLVDAHSNSVHPVVYNTSNDGSFFIVPDEASWMVETSEQYWVKVESLSENGTTYCGGCFGDLSDGSITFYKNEFELIYPNGGETFDRGEPTTISWTYDNTTEYVTIELWKDGTEVQDIYYSLENTQSHNWTPLQALTPGDGYQIKIYSWELDESDLSDSTFTIQ